MSKVLLLVVLNCFFAFSQDTITHDVYFESDKYNIPEIEENRLLLFTRSLSDLNIDSISIFGFCDDTGSHSYNLKLSQKRADIIQAYFLNNTKNPSLISKVDGKGEIVLQLVNEKDVLKTRGLNRRVEIIVKTKTPKPIIAKDSVIIDKEKNVIDLIKESSKGDKIVFKNILFNTGYASITDDSKLVLDQIAKALLERGDIYFTIQGHVCCTHLTRDAIDRKTNKRNLSEARAKFVYNYFAGKGIEKKRMRYLGLRRRFPLGGDAKFDRRVEIVITYANKP